MFTVCVGLVFGSKYVQFPIICSFQYSININTVEVDPHSNILHICIVKPKNNQRILEISIHIPHHTIYTLDLYELNPLSSTITQ